MNEEGLSHPEKWAVETFGAAELGDLRRTDRLIKIAAAIAENPSASLPESMRNWSDTLAAYRFLDNEAVTHEQIMHPHWMTTREEVMCQGQLTFGSCKFPPKIFPGGRVTPDQREEAKRSQRRVVHPP